LKILHKAQMVKKGQVDHIKNEMTVLSTVDHPFIVKFQACWQDQKSIYMLMDFINGGELFSAIREWKIPEKQAQLWIAEMVLAIEYLHSKDVAHRDIKPENALLDNEGHLRLTDFGFAKVVETCLWTLCGTPEYTAPEVIRGKGHGCGVDWWALGILTYEVLAGFAPFRADTMSGIHEKILLGKYTIPSYFSHECKSLIKGLLQGRSRRLGCTHEGAKGIKTHAWFGTVDFSEVLYRRAPSSYIPSVSSLEDTSQFKKYRDSVDDDLPTLSAEQQALFDFDFCERRTSGVEISEWVPYSAPVDWICSPGCLRSP